MLEYIKKYRIFVLCLLAFVGFITIINLSYSKETIVIERDKLISNSWTYVENNTQINATTSNNEFLIWINDQATVVPSDKFIEILTKYKSKKSKLAYFPYESEKILVSFTVVQNNEHRNFLLGDFNIWYKTGKTKGNEIIDGDILLSEILELADYKYQK